MSFIGTIQTGPSADSYRLQWPAVITVPASSAINTGTPLRRNYLAIQGINPGVVPFIGISPSLGLNGGDQVVLPTSNAGGYYYGTYSGPTINNLTGVGTSVVTPLVTVSGVQYSLVGAVSGGTAVTIGAVVGLTTNAVGTAALQNFLTVLTSTQLGQTVGVVAAYPIATNVGVSAFSAGSASIGVPNIAGFATTQAVIINPGGSNQETVTPTTVTAGTLATETLTFTGTSVTTAGPFVVTFGNASTGAVPGVPGGIVTVSVTVASGQTNANVATSVALALNSAFFNYGAAGNNIPGIGAQGSRGYSAGTNVGLQSGIQPFGFVQVSASSVVNISAAVPGTGLNNVPVTVTGAAGITLASSGASFTAGTQNVVVATFASAHVAGEPIVGTVTVAGATICAVPAVGGATVTLAQVAST